MRRAHACVLCSTCHMHERSKECGSCITCVFLRPCSTEEGSGGEPEIELEDDGTEGVPLAGCNQLPVVLSCALLGRKGLVVDPGLVEEKAAKCTLHIAVSSLGLCLSTSVRYKTLKQAVFPCGTVAQLAACAAMISAGRLSARSAAMQCPAHVCVSLRRWTTWGESVGYNRRARRAWGPQTCLR